MLSSEQHCSFLGIETHDYGYLLPLVKGNSNSMDPATLRKKILADQNSETGEKVTINVSGTRFVTWRRWLLRLPNGRLFNLNKNNAAYNRMAEEYFFARNPQIFQSIFDLYTTGELHFNQNWCGASVRRELSYWGIDECLISPCCKKIITSYEDEIANAERMAAVFNSGRWRDASTQRTKFSLRGRIWHFLDDPTTTSGKVWNIARLTIVFFSIAVMIVRTTTILRSFEHGYNDTALYNVPEGISPKDWMYKITHLWPGVYYADYACTGLFTLDLLIRAVLAPQKKAFLKSPLNLVDIICLSSEWYIIVLRIIDAHYESVKFPHSEQIYKWAYSMKVLRVVRVFRFSRKYSGLRILALSLRASFRELVLMASILSISVITYAVLVYNAEFDEPNLFLDVPRSCWWSVVTLTTVGYGDLYPETLLGKVIGCTCAISGIVLISLLIPIIAKNFSEFYRYARIAEKAEGMRRWAQRHNQLQNEKTVNGELHGPGRKRLLEMHSKKKKVTSRQLGNNSQAEHGEFSRLATDRAGVSLNNQDDQDDKSTLKIALDDQSENCGMSNIGKTIASTCRMTHRPISHKSSPKLATEAWSFVRLVITVLSITLYCFGTTYWVRYENPAKVNATASSLKESNPKKYMYATTHQYGVMHIIDYICTFFFTGEFIVRLVTCPNKKNFFKEALNIIDLLCLTADWFIYITNRFWKIKIPYGKYIWGWIYSMKVLRVFRLFKTNSKYSGLRVVILSMKASLPELLLMSMILILGITTFSILIYNAEFRNPLSFVDIPSCGWWVIITMTTVGYGDVYPVTTVGKIVGALCALTGIVFLSLLIPIIAANFTEYYTFATMKQQEGDLKQPKRCNKTDQSPVSVKEDSNLNSVFPIHQRVDFETPECTDVVAVDGVVLCEPWLNRLLPESTVDHEHSCTDIRALKTSQL